MLTQEEVKRYAHARRLRLIDQIWKDYLQDVLLHLLYKKMPKMTFGGGTCIWKVMKGDRFSEDIDAYCMQIPEDISEYLKKELSFLGVSCNVVKRRTTANMLFLKLALSLPTHPREIIVSIEILSAQPKNTTRATLYSPYPDIPPVEMVILQAEEMLANKVSAVYKRNMPRDVHDIYFLLKRGTIIDAKLVRQKMPNFNVASFEKKLMEKKAAWKSLESLIAGKLPGFEEEMKFIVVQFRRAF